MEQCSYCLQSTLVTPVGRGQLKTCVKCKPYIPEFSVRPQSEHSVMEPQIVVHSGNQQIEMDMVLHCPICNKTFERSLQYQNHMRNHRAERKFVCETCNKAFSQSNNLRAHLRIHNNERPYKCNECGKAFTQVTNLNNHMRLHTGERPFACTEPGCDKAFAQVTNLNNHRKCHQKEPRTFECEICHTVFQYRSHLTLHRATHGPVRGRPPLTNRTSGSSSCKECGETFETEKLMKKHMKEICSERFSIKKESQSLVGVNIKCLFGDCETYFDDKQSLQLHLSQDHSLSINLDKDEKEGEKSDVTKQSHFIENIINDKTANAVHRSEDWREDSQVAFEQRDEECYILGK